MNKPRVPFAPGKQIESHMGHNSEPFKVWGEKPPTPGSDGRRTPSPPPNHSQPPALPPILNGVCKVVDACGPLDAAVDSVVVMEADGTMLFINKACSDLFGYSKEEARSRNVKMLMGEPFSSAHDGFLQRYQVGLP